MPAAAALAWVPKTEPEFEEMAKLTGRTVAEVRHRTNTLYETNPMLGHRGCRLGITSPEIYEMQAVAIFEAAVAAMRDDGAAVDAEIMVPLIATKREFDILKEMVDRVGAYAEAGADWVILAMRAPFDRDGLERFASEVLPQLR